MWDSDNMAGSTTIYPIVEPNAAYLVFKQRGLYRAGSTPVSGSTYENTRLASRPKTGQIPSAACNSGYL
ncbi:hypothetical protein PGQ11_006120 [Apiospora arundinis]|uniref:Uncharacterized protein n=1 Tax=Apiospora arundinis TaxID=335852 RepID=A0ABR2IRR2_9PEZI